ncbi:DUF2785 domain-containing protein [Thalassotalea sp. 1_MG-2023]|uniref:DUF2785 domain-containing protein n=1 Tax=Thalassotalea sp. 1_MG-2023 TaxID=3062680 RepID=UPI0026E2E015|nr:DUF2785 domain-containing protein [Thalassotalea sp. 1_MG-2023]MDO6426681.1 DUF2785 domain-containing protein [Thalassotalea sp. 1_MG-2023]
MQLHSLVLMGSLLLFTNAALASHCHQQLTVEALKSLKTNDFTIEEDKKRNNLAITLLNCLSHPDPKIRDEIVYQAYSTWLRNKALDTETINTLLFKLQTILASKSKDPNGFEQPFAALVLSEVVRVDRITPYMSEQERQTIVDVSTRFMSNISDYRGFNEQEGWRHNVAHTADIFLQLALNKQVTKAQHQQLLTAIKQQISPKNTFYTFGEPKRLAMPVVYIILQNKLSADEFANWLTSVTSPAPFETWQSVYQSEQGLAKLHNTRSFLHNLYVITSNSKNPQLKAIQASLQQALTSLG